MRFLFAAAILCIAPAVAAEDPATPEQLAEIVVHLEKPPPPVQIAPVDPAAIERQRARVIRRIYFALAALHADIARLYFILGFLENESPDGRKKYLDSIVAYQKAVEIQHPASDDMIAHLGDYLELVEGQ